jgi:peptidylprolyl isomerase
LALIQTAGSHPRHLIFFILALTCSCCISCSDSITNPPSDDSPRFELVCTSSGLCYRDLVIGRGAAAHEGMSATVGLVCWLGENGHKGTLIDSSYSLGRVYKFTLGDGTVIKGFDEGITGMRVRGKRTLIVPPDLAYGDRGIPGLVPPGATLIFDIWLVGLSSESSSPL